MERNLKKIISVLLSVILMCGLMPVPSFAASNIAIPSVDSSTYIRTYCLAASGRISVYTNESLTSQNSSEYIDAATDECYIMGLNTTYNSVWVSYPTSSGRKSRWASMDVFTQASSYKVVCAAVKCTTYKRNSTQDSYGSISAGDTVYVYETRNSMTRVIYPISNGYKMAWVQNADFKYSESSSDNTTLAYYASRVGQVIANTSSYTTNLDGYIGIKGQCVWYVRNRGYEKLGNGGLTGIGGNANTWFNSAVKKGLSTGSTPRMNSIACWNGGSYGHVAFVEYYDSAAQIVYFTEGNWPNSTDGTLKKMSLSQFKSHTSGYQGCIYLQ